jgi:hypothetical protein
MGMAVSISPRAPLARARDLLEESVRGLPRDMAAFPHLPADRNRPVPHFGPFSPPALSED